MVAAKSVSHLTVDDLEACGIWEYALDEEREHDETWIRPCLGRERATGRGELVRTRFVGAGGQLYVGFAVAADTRDLPSMQPVIVTPAGAHVGFWAGALPLGDLAAEYAALGAMPHQLFPLTFRSDVPTLGKKLFGELVGFGRYDDNRSIIIER